MSPLLLPLVTFLVLYPLKIFLFEASFGVLLALPILSFLFSKIITPSILLYGVIWIALVGGLYALYWRDRHTRTRFSVKEELAPCAAFLCCYFVCFTLCLLWPDFISMGERIRDYALLSSVLHSPVEPREPWMSGSVLNYYIYWYRFGQVLSSFFDLPTWALYHRLQSFTFALFVASTFRLARTHLGFSLLGSIAAAVIVGFGSNIDGIQLALAHDDNWWRPSRVITGAINEFPAWSFLLGDLHPHYLNLCLLPFALLLFASIAESSLALTVKTALLLLFSCISMPIWIFNANAWEIPLWMGVCASIGGSLLFILEPSGIREGAQRFSIEELKNSKFWTYGTLLLLGAFSLFLSSRNISTGGDPFQLVRSPVKRSYLFELMKHWGLPFSIIVIGNLLLVRKLVWQFGALIALFLAVIAEEALPFLYFTLFLTACRAYADLVETKREGKDLFRALFPEALGVASIIFVILPELVFLNDPYGGENERMNTIFKVYTFNWMLLHLYGFYVLAKSVKLLPAKLQKAPVLFVQGAALLLLLNFTYRTIQVRKSSSFDIVPLEQGLSQLNKMYAGAGAALKQFEALPPGLTLEGQGPPYSLTSHVSTLGGKEAFLGWANHVNLLTRNYGEVTRREEFTKNFYSPSTSCEKRRDLMGAEKITYVVWGPLEQKSYPDLSIDGFSCLDKKISEGMYNIYTVNSSSAAL